MEYHEITEFVNAHFEQPPFTVEEFVRKMRCANHPDIDIVKFSIIQDRAFTMHMTPLQFLKTI